MIAAIATIIMIVVMRLQGASLISAVSPSGIVNFEFAGTLSKAKEIMNALSIKNLKTNTYLDFLFIGAYTSLLYFICKWLMKNYHSITLKWIGFFFLELCIAVGSLDILENITMLITLSGNGSNLSTGISRWAAILKFGGIALIFIYIILSGAGIYLSRKKR